MILPANTAWDTSDSPAETSLGEPALHRPSQEAIEATAARLKSEGAALMIGGLALFGPLRELAGKISAVSGCRLMADTLFPRISKGAGQVKPDQLVYAITPKIAQLQDTLSITLIGCKRPVSFFAYPERPSTPEPAGCTISNLCTRSDDLK